MEPKYKVGDRVKVIKRTKKASDYRFTFVDDKAKLEGQVYKINGVGNFRPDPSPVPDDGYLYSLEDSGGFNWASSMFELVEETPLTV